MADNPNAEIIAIGTELLLGEITDTNSVFMARALRDIGINVFYMTTVGDNLARIANAIDLALDRAEIIITCGGLGPTVDDMTRQAVADATQRDLEFQQVLFDAIAERFRGFGVTMTDNNSQQAYLPQNARLIENPVGTAPSFIVETDRGVVISLPGVPREMKYLMTSAVVPYLLEQYNLGIIIARVLKTAGIGESSLDDMIGKELLSQSNPTIGLAAHHGSVDVRLTAKADTVEKADLLLDSLQSAVYEKIGGYIYGINNATLESTVSEFLIAKNLKIAVFEAGLPDAILSKIDSDSLCAQTYTYTHPDEVYSQFNIQSDIALKDCAIEVAKHLLDQNDVFASIVILSYPDIDESADIEQGSTIVVMSDPESPRYRVYGFGAKSDLAKDWIPRWGLSTLWRKLREQFDDVG